MIKNIRVWIGTLVQSSGNVAGTWVKYEDVIRMLEELKNDQTSVGGRNGGGSGTGERGESEGALGNGRADGGYVDSDSFAFWDGPYC